MPAVVQLPVRSPDDVALASGEGEGTYAVPDAPPPPKLWTLGAHGRSRPPPPPPMPTQSVTTEAVGASIEGAMSQGTAAQVLSVGPQDTYLHVNPEITFFRQMWRRHTPFAVECFEERFPTSVRFGDVATCVLGKHGDFFGDMTLRLVLPALGPGAWVDAVGYMLLSRVRLRVGDTVVHDQERLWYDLDDAMFCREGRRGGLNRMIGRGVTLDTAVAQEILVPLKFLCCVGHRGARQFLPTAVDADVCVDLFVESLDALATLAPGTIAPPTATVDAVVLVDNVFVAEHAEKKSTTSLMYDDSRDVDALSYKVTTTGAVDSELVTVDMRSLNLPVRYVIVVAYDEAWKDPFAYRDAVASMTFYIGSNQQFAPRDGAFFEAIQPYDRGVRCAGSNVGLYSFALDAAAWQPNGHLNFAALTSPTMKVWLKPTPAGTAPLKIKVFASVVNWLDFGAGACALRYVA